MASSSPVSRKGITRSQSTKPESKNWNRRFSGSRHKSKSLNPPRPFATKRSIGRSATKSQESRMRKSAITNRRKQLKQLKADAADGKARADHIVELTSNDLYKQYLLGQIKLLEPIRSREDYIAQYEQFRDTPKAQVQQLLEESKKLPRSNGQKWNKRRNAKIGIVADEFLFNSLESAADFVPLTPDNFKSEIPKLDLVLIVSAWRGLDGEWLGLAQQSWETRRIAEEELIPFAKQHDLPVIFYSKEDPPNYANFLGLARLADYVFTSAEEMIPKYKNDLGDDAKVSAIRFGVNYQYHNPLGSARHTGREILFAGSWLRHKYSQRRAAAEKIFDGVVASEEQFVILDRNLELDPEAFSNLERYNFPDRFVPHLHAPLDHRELQEIQRLLPLAINLNSVVASQTMFANRVVELQAMGTLLLSNYSAGVNTLYPNVTMLDSKVDTEQFLRTLSDDYIKYCQVEGIRSVFLGDTAFERVDTILDAAGIESPADSHHVYVVANTRESFEEFERSQATDVPLIFVPSDEADSLRGTADGDLVIFPERIRLDSPDIVSDAICAYRYSAPSRLYIDGFDSDLPAYEWFDSEDQPPHALWLDHGTTPADAGTLSLRIRTSGRTKSDQIPATENPDISVIVPVYNNGKHLLHKCMQSLRRSSIYPKSEILLVDDGSTDVKTKAILRLLDSVHGNVKVFSFPEGGSGSASRPRNKGLELTRTPWVTYLDPDNEQVNDAYSTLLGMIEGDEDANFAIGNMVRFKDKRSTFNNARFLKNAIAKTGQLNGKNNELLKELNFKPMSIQALVADTDWLRSLGIEQPLGAVGQDSYFFQQMLYYADKILISKLPAHIYYADVANSTVNSISPNYYRKYLPLEKSRAAWLREVGLLESYQATRFNQFLEHWYVKKLENVAPVDLDECLTLIREIIEIYGMSETTDHETARIMQVAEDLRRE
ncbi:hypothetical protein CKJ81_05320 [Corynebacterium hadale]|uniref:Glycosyltransferase 2-like domain-containing protein n=2 Tax=Corynebacterium hadale TaxID=2026255 RepID=A0ABX4HBK2_9CORY|nr:hypothetical protein CKJ81_05320 [Corynebacterium hadale]